MLDIRERLSAETDEQLLFLSEDYFDAAILGTATQWNGPTVVVYDVHKCIECLMVGNEWDEEEATEYFYYNTKGSYVGPQTPLFVDPIDSVE